MHERCAHCSSHDKQRAKKHQKERTKGAKSAIPSSEQTAANSGLLSRREAAAYLGLSEQTLAIWKCADRYDLPVIKLGRLARYRRSDLDAFLDRNTWDGGKRRGDGRGR